MEQIVVVWRQVELLGWLAIEQDLTRAANVGGAFFGGEQERAQRHDGGLRGAPCSRSIFLRGDVLRALRAVRSLTRFEQRLHGEPGGLDAGARAGGIDAGLFRAPPDLFVFLGARVQQKLHRLPRELAVRRR